MTTTPVGEIDHDGDRFLIRFPYDPQLVEAVKRLPRRRWDADRKLWTAEWSDRLAPFVTAHQFTVTDNAQRALDTGEPVRSQTGTVSQFGPRLIAAIDYDPTVVAAIRDIPGRRWDADRKVWTFPLTSIRATRQLADTHGLVWQVPDTVEDTEPVTALQISRHRDRLLIRFDWDRDLSDEVRDIPGVEWDRFLQCWTVPTGAAVDVLELVDRHPDAIVDPSAVGLLHDAEQVAARIAASRASDADLMIDGLGGELLPFQKAGVRYVLDALGFVPDDHLWTRPALTPVA